MLCAQDDESDLEDGDVDDEEDEDDEEEEEEEGAQLITSGPSRSSSLAEGVADSCLSTLLFLSHKPLEDWLLIVSLCT